MHFDTDALQERAGPIAWANSFSPPERRTFWACFSGCALDNLDAQLFSLLIPTLIGLWGMTRGEAGLIATSTLLTGAIGGLAAGYLADRFGRVLMLQITVIWFSVFTFLSGLTNSPEQLLLVRCLQGLGFGGELAVGAVLIGEVIRARDRGTIMGLVASGYAVGAVAAGIVFSATFLLLPPEIAWRATFWVGILPAFLVIYVRRNVQEPALATASRGARPKISRLFATELRRSTLLGTLLVVGATASINALFIWLPTFLQQERGLSVTNTGVNYIIATSGMVLGYLLGAYSLDRMGRRAVFVIGALATGVCVAVYLWAPLSSGLLTILGFLVGAAVVWTNVGMSPLLAELYPTSVRGSGLGFCYSVGRGVGALAPGLVGFLSAFWSLGTVIGFFVAAGYLLVCACVLLLPETRGLIFKAERSE